MALPLSKLPFAQLHIHSQSGQISVKGSLSVDLVDKVDLVFRLRQFQWKEKQVPLSGGATFQELLEQQLTLFNLDDDDQTIALHLIGSLDDSGYLRREVEAIVDDLAFTQNVITDEEHVGKILQIIQHFDPPGVGARDLQECLLLQVKKKNDHSLLTLNVVEVLEKNVNRY